MYIVCSFDLYGIDLSTCVIKMIYNFVSDLNFYKKCS